MGQFAAARSVVATVEFMGPIHQVLHLVLAVGVVFDIPELVAQRIYPIIGILEFLTCGLKVTAVACDVCANGVELAAEPVIGSSQLCVSQCDNVGQVVVEPRAGRLGGSISTRAMGDKATNAVF
jgi:hypothetical protein